MDEDALALDDDRLQPHRVAVWFRECRAVCFSRRSMPTANTEGAAMDREGWPLGSILGNLSAHADGEHRGLDQIEGWCRKCLGETRLWVHFRSDGASAFAVGMLRGIEDRRRHEV